MFALSGFSKLLPVIASLLVLTSCGRRVTDTNLREIKPDMSAKEVESILGPPTRADNPHELTLQRQLTLPVTRYFYDQNGTTVELTFVGDKLASGGVKGSFGE
jgi:hypothetical protein